MISEPLTMITDYLLSLFALFYGVSLLLNSKGQRTLKYWSLAFLALSTSALLGGTFHGFTAYLTDIQRLVLWKSTLGFISLMGFFLIVSSSTSAVSKKSRKIINYVATLKFLIFLTILIFSNQFVLVIIDYGLSMLAVLALYSFRYHKDGMGSNAKWIIMGVLISFIAATVQILKFNISPSFNNNDLYHVIQIVALYFFYKGARKLFDAK